MAARLGPTRFRSSATIRDGRAVALAQDAIDLLDGLGVKRCLVVGHDWGGRVAYHLGALLPERLTAIAALGIGYASNGKFEVPGFEQARLWWYQWLMATEGANTIRADPIGFARAQWNHWSPYGWFDEPAFERTADSFRNPDWAAITLHGYRARWRDEVLHQRYAAAQAQIEATCELSVPTLMIVGREDRADFPEESGESCFPAGYRRIVLDQVGHFPARETPGIVANAILAFIGERTAN